MDSDDSNTWWILSVVFSISALIAVMVKEIRNSILIFLNTKRIDTKFNSVGPKGITNKKYIQPSQKESSIEIKQNLNKNVDTEHENMMKKIESLKVKRTLYIMSNDLDVLPLPDQPLKRYSSHYSLENSGNFTI